MKSETRRMAKVHDESGFSLLETLIATSVLLIAVTSVLNLFLVVITQNESQGDLGTRTAEYSQDKMEQLLRLDFNDGSTDTAAYPPAATGGTGLGGTMAASSTVPTAPPITGYVDYLDQNGNLLTSSTGALYTRQWSISTDSTATLKTITVIVTSKVPAGPQGAAPSSTLVCEKSSGL
jgi:type II secretory pathway pseudopilin PulG